MEPKQLSIELKRKYGVVMTPPGVVSEMLDMLNEDNFGNPEIIFFEPTCGDGAFVVQILERQLNAFFKKTKNIKQSITLSIDNFWAIDILMDNISIARARAYNTIIKFLKEKCIDPESMSIFLGIINCAIVYHIHENEMITALCKDEEEAFKKSRKTKASTEWFDNGLWRPINFNDTYLTMTGGMHGTETIGG